MNARDVAQLGQVFTPPLVVEAMLRLRRRKGSVLEPSCGDGAFFLRLPGAVGVELDPRFAPPGAWVGDFFAWDEAGRFDTIIGNPPYVRFQDIAPQTRERLPRQDFDRRSNLYLFFIHRCLDLLADGGELIFITPRDFLKATSACGLNRRLFALGTITHAIELGDKKSFEAAVPNCLIWRFEKGDFSRRTAFIDAARHPSLEAALEAAARDEWETRYFHELAGHLAFPQDPHAVPLSEVFSVRVGAVSGLDKVFSSDAPEALDFVCSHTATSGRTRRLLWQAGGPHPALVPHKDRLLARRIRRFDGHNWWHWGRGFPETDAPRIYVNHKTRRQQPFFLHPCTRFDGAVLALFPHDPTYELSQLRAMLNAVDWAAQGFVCDGRFIFGQRSLEQAVLPEAFAAFAKKP